MLLAIQRPVVTTTCRMRSRGVPPDHFERRLRRLEAAVPGGGSKETGGRFAEQAIV